MGILPNPLHLVTVTAFGAKLPLTGVVRNSSLWDVCQVNLLVVNGGVEGSDNPISSSRNIVPFMVCFWRGDRRNSIVVKNELVVYY
ncbi:hypothetical protein CDAR_396861 [Caerostris darwini]|uniref:Uncharacterized protein n=1 Tax=Caerostris darwini TaxID=1538125 RepID=A0AAV4WLQ5_9ARAC|nr:hypothetical protein CDAR_396861 [Caerostris darwini]